MLFEVVQVDPADNLILNFGRKFLIAEGPGPGGTRQEVVCKVVGESDLLMLWRPNFFAIKTKV
jgi:hypothetical protein